MYDVFGFGKALDLVVTAQCKFPRYIAKQKLSTYKILDGMIRTWTAT
jgi:hypothetical protein